MWLDEDKLSGDEILAEDITNLSYAYQNMAMNTNSFKAVGVKYDPPVHELGLVNTTATKIQPFGIVEPVETNDEQGRFFVRPYTGGKINYLLIVDENGLDGDSQGWGSLAIDPVFMRHSMPWEPLDPADDKAEIARYNVGNNVQKFFGPKPNDPTCIGYPDLPPFQTLSIATKTKTGNVVLVKQRFEVDYSETMAEKFTVPDNSTHRGAPVPITATFLFNIAVSNYVPDQTAEDTNPDSIKMKVYKVGGGSEKDLEVDGESDWMRFQLPKYYQNAPPGPKSPLLTIQSGFSRSGLVRLRKGETVGYRIEGPSQNSGSLNSFINLRRVAPYFDGTL